MNSIPEDYYVEMAEKALHFETDNFVCWDERIGDTHFLVGPVVHRDSDILEQSNFQVIHENFNDVFGDDGSFFIVHSDHWAVGWVDQIAVRMLNKELDLDYQTIEYSDLHPAFILAVDWYEALQQYPVADESHYSEMETNKCIDNLFHHCNYYISREDCEMVHWNLFDMGYYPEDCWYTDEQIRECVFYLYQSGSINVWDNEDLEDLALYALEQAIKENANV